MKYSVFLISFVMLGYGILVESAQARPSKNKNVEEVIKRVIQQEAEKRGIVLTVNQIHTIYQATKPPFKKNKNL